MATKRPLHGLTTKQQEALGKIRQAILHHRNAIMNGTLVSIDPSAVSRTGSKPAYAIYVRGEFVEQGILDVQFKPQLYLRLQMLRKLITDSLAPHVDIVIIEETPHVPIRTMAGARAGGKCYMNPASIASLKKACGAIISGFNVGTPVIEMPANLWQKMCHNAGIVITKADPDDARLIGWAAITLLCEINHTIDGVNHGDGKTKTEDKGKAQTGTTIATNPIA